MLPHEPFHFLLLENSIARQMTRAHGGFNERAQAISKPDCEGKSKALLFAFHDGLWKIATTQSARHIFDPAMPQLPIGRNAHHVLSYPPVEKRAANLETMRHGHAIHDGQRVLGQSRHAICM